MHYRAEIDGLRALAVLPVILFHAGFSAFSGGYVGVDIFFVISGYLITSIIAAEMASGSFSLAGFYERRARRILPALFLVIAACTVVAPLVMMPSDLKAFFRSVIAAVFFSSNILFYSEARGYFADAAELKPLLHTWSLGVEEQYYLLFPLFIMLVWKRGPKSLFLGIALIAFASFAVSQWWALHKPIAAFFLLPSRLWELMIGALLALYLKDVWPAKRTALNEVLSILGFGCIIASIAAFDEQVPFPGIYALLPVAGAALIIVCATSDTLIGNLLGSKPLVAIGLVSYSAYLWHQPLFAFARHATPNPSNSLFIGLAIAAFALAYFSWRYVEQPFRNRQLTGLKTVVGSAVAGASCLSLAAVLGTQGIVLNNQLPANVKWESLGDKISNVGRVCEATMLPRYPGVEACYFGDTAAETTVALYGDSHALAMSYELDKTFKERRIKGVRVAAKGCQVVPRISSTLDKKEIERCFKAYSSLMSFISDNVSGVILVSLWTGRLFPLPDNEAALPDIRARGVQVGRYREWAAMASDGTFSKGAEAKRAAVLELLTTMLATGKKIVLVYPIPPIDVDIARLNHFDRKLETISTSHDEYRQKNAFVSRIFDGFPDDGRLFRVKPDQVLCNGYLPGRCMGQVKSVPLYLDTNHVSDAGAALIVPLIMAGLK